MRKKLIFLALSVLVSLPEVLQAQRRTRYRHEWLGSIGFANFLGELGGANQIGTNGLKDFDFEATRPAISFGYRYKDSRWVGFKTGLYLAMVNGNDNRTLEPFRNNRNLHFRSPIVELSGQVELYLTKERKGSIYRLKTVRGVRGYNIQLYGFVGLGGIFFNPQAKYKGYWINLQPLGTEGQGLLPEKKKYSRFNVVVPIGIAGKVALDRRWSIALEYGMRKTFTDYLDDVSTVYFDKGILFEKRGELAAHFSDPSLGLNPNPGTNVTAPGMQRGDPADKDAYMLANITLSYKVMTRRRTRAKF